MNTCQLLLNYAHFDMVFRSSYNILVFEEIKIQDISYLSYFISKVRRT